MPCPDLVRALVPELLPLLTGFTTPALSALVHLVEAWNVADENNARRCALAIRAVLYACHSRTSRPLAWFIILNRLGVHGTRKLVSQLDASTFADSPTGASLSVLGMWRAELAQAIHEAPASCGIYLCCGRAVLRDGQPGMHLGAEACTELQAHHW